MRWLAVVSEKCPSKWSVMIGGANFRDCGTLTLLLLPTSGRSRVLMERRTMCLISSLLWDVCQDGAYPLHMHYLLLLVIGYAAPLCDRLMWYSYRSAKSNGSRPMWCSNLSFIDFQKNQTCLDRKWWHTVGCKKWRCSGPQITIATVTRIEAAFLRSWYIVNFNYIDVLCSWDVL